MCGPSLKQPKELKFIKACVRPHQSLDSLIYIYIYIYIYICLNPASVQDSKKATLQTFHLERTAGAAEGQIAQKRWLRAG